MEYRLVNMALPRAEVIKRMLIPVDIDFSK
jgi:hypothetical protein